MQALSILADSIRVSAKSLFNLVSVVAKKTLPHSISLIN